MIREDYIKSVHEWPAEQGGGEEVAQDMVI
jgi:hypothetical protein